MSDPVCPRREPDLVDLSIDEAMALRWRRGRVDRGLGPLDPFEGDPMRELYEELIDSLCYAREAKRQRRALHPIERTLRQLAVAVRDRIRNIEDPPCRGG